MLTEEQFIRELNEKTAQYFQYVTQDSPCETRQLQDVLNEIKFFKDKTRENFDYYKEIQFRVRPDVPLESLVDELELCEESITAILNNQFPKLRK